jgi:hypothetical protein
MYDFLRLRMAALTAALLTLAFVAAPLVFQHAMIAYANLPLTFYLTAAVITIAWAGLEPSSGLRLRLLALSGISLALAAWTRPEGLVMSALFAVIAAVLLFFQRGKKFQLAELTCLGAPLMIYAVLWLATSPMVYRGTTWVGAEFKSGLNEVFVSATYLQSLIYVVRSYLLSLVDLQVWGVLGFMVLIVLLAARLCSPLRWPTNLLICCGLALTLAVLAAYPLLASTSDSDISWWVNAGLTRMLLPGMAILWLGVIYGLIGPQSN